MDKIKIATFSTISIDSLKGLMYWVAFLNLFYKRTFGKETEGNRPLFHDIAGHLFFCYNKWTIASESVDELSGIRRYPIEKNF